MNYDSKVLTRVPKLVGWLNKGSQSENFRSGSTGTIITTMHTEVKEEKDRFWGDPETVVGVRLRNGVFAQYRLQDLKEITEEEFETALLLES